MDFTYIGIFTAGLLTFVSPCVLPMVPIISANYLMTNSTSRFAKLRATLLFSAGFMLTFTLMGLSLPMITSLLGEAKDLLLFLSAAVLLLYGLKMAKILSFSRLSESRFFSWMDRSAYLPNFEKLFPKQVHGFLFGASFGLAWTPCVGPILGGVLTYVATESASTVESTLLMLTFASGIVLPFIAISFGGDLVQSKLNRLKAYLPKIEEYTGYGLILIAGFIFFQVQLPRFDEGKDQLGQIPIVLDGQKTTLSEIASDSSKLLFFTSEYCPVCQQMEKFMPAIEKECSSPDFKIVRINMDKMGNSELANHFNIRATPTMSLLSKDNNELAHTVGYQSELNLRRALSMVPGLSCEKSSAEVQAPQYQEGEACDPAKGGLTC